MQNAFKDHLLKLHHCALVKACECITMNEFWASKPGFDTCLWAVWRCVHQEGPSWTGPADGACSILARSANQTRRANWCTRVLSKWTCGSVRYRLQMCWKQSKVLKHTTCVSCLCIYSSLYCIPHAVVEQKDRSMFRKYAFCCLLKYMYAVWNCCRFKSRTTTPVEPIIIWTSDGLKAQG